MATSVATMNFSNFNCTTSSNESCSQPASTEVIALSSDVIICLTLLNTLSVIVGTFGNTLVLLAVIKNSCLQTVPDLFIFSLAVADLMVTLLRQPLLIYQVNTSEEKAYVFHHPLFMVIKGIGDLSLFATLTNLFAVTVDRYFAICHPFRYISLATKQRAILVVLIVWLKSTVFAVVIEFDKNAGLFIFGYISSLLVLIIILYIHLLAVATKQQNKVAIVHSQEKRNTVGDTNLQGRQKRERKAAKTIAIVVGVFVLCLTPHFVVFKLAQPIFIKRSLFSLAMCNSAINPYIYCARNTRYRSAFARLLCWKGNVNDGRSGGVANVLNEHQSSPA